MRFPSSPTSRRGSAALNFLLLMVVVALSFGAYVLWQRNERIRIEAEAADKIAEKEAASGEVDISKITEIAIVEPKTIPRPPVLIVEPYVEENTPPPVDTRPDLPDWKTVEFENIPEGADVLRTLQSGGYKFTTAMMHSYMRYAKAKARAELKESQRELPEEFMRWVESDPERMLAVYCCRAEAARVLVMLRSLELDLGKEDARSPKFNQLVLATAIACANQAEIVDLKDRKPLTLTIPTDPRVRVNTKDPKRTLDKYDHIINFLEDHEPGKGDLAGGLTWALPEIVAGHRDSVSLPSSTKKPEYSLDHKIPATTKRTLIAADVFASAKLQAEFNDYMKAKGFADVKIDCGDKVIFAGLIDAVKGPHAGGILEAYRLFKKAYELKGRLAVREKAATAYERCAYIIRNEKKTIVGPKKAHLPSFPINAPWPMLMFLAAEGQPLREREEILERFKKTGQFICYGEYTGPIAQQGDYLTARRLAPFAFGDNSYQQILKDGGVCGRMANMERACENTAGVPSSTAGQPGHCAGIHAYFDAKSRKYGYSGYQYVTGGDDLTNPHVGWLFMDIDSGRPMTWHQASAYATNLGMKSFLESMAAYQIYRLIPSEVKEERPALGFPASAITVNPYNVAIAQLAFATGESDETLKLWDTFEAAVKSSSKKAGNRNDLYLRAVRGPMVDRLSKLPAPKDAALAAKLEKFKELRTAELESIARQMKAAQ
jgi:hypothetical protein